MIYVKPAKPGALVPDPDAPQDSSATARLPAEGRWVKRSVYWLRRLRHGDVVEATPPAKAAKPKTMAAPKPAKSDQPQVEGDS